MGSLELKRFPAGIYVQASGQTLFFPYKIIQFLTLKKEGTAESPTWTLHIRTNMDKINLSTSRSIEEEFREICMHFHG